MKQTGMMLDIARTSFSKADIQSYIDFVKENGGHYLQLHFSDSSRYAIESKVLGNQPKQDLNDYILSLEEVKELSEYAKGKGIELIPELELPAHSNKLLDLLFNHNWDYWNSVRTHEGGYQLHLGSPETYQLTKELITELVGAFTNTQTIHLGGDEFEYGSENTPVNVCNFFNNLSLWILETYNYRTRVWNDFITKDILNNGMLNTRIDVVFWSQTGEATKGSDVEAERLRTRATTQEIVDYGNNIWNAQAWFCYSVPNDTRDFTSWNSVYAGRDLIERWDLSVTGYQNTFTRLKNTDKVLGSMFCVWTENLVHDNYSGALKRKLKYYLEYHVKAMFNIVNSYNTENIITANDLINAPYKFYILADSPNLDISTEVIGKFELIDLNSGNSSVQLTPFNSSNEVEFTVKESSIQSIDDHSITLKSTLVVTWNNSIQQISYDEFYKENTNMPLIRFEKIVHSLPTGSEIKPNTVYYLREGQGFSTYVSDATGSIIHSLNISEDDKSPNSIKEQIEALKTVVKNTSDKLNGLSSETLAGALFLDYTNDSAIIKLEISKSNDSGYKLVISTESEGIDLKFNLGYDSTVSNVVLNSKSPVEVKIPEVIVESLNEFDAHFYRKVIQVSDIKVKKTRTFSSIKWRATVNNVNIEVDSGSDKPGLYLINFNNTQSSSTLDLNLADSFNLYLFSLVCDGKEYKSISTSSQISFNNPVQLMTKDDEGQFTLPSESQSNRIIAIKTVNNDNESSTLSFTRYLSANGTTTEAGLKSFKLLEFNQVFSESESDLFNVHNFSAVAKSVDDIINPVLISEKNMKWYGSRLDQTGHPIYIYGRTQGWSDSIVYAYFTDLSRWLLYSYHDGGGFMSNASKLKPYHSAGGSRSFIMGDGVISDYSMTANISTTGDVSYKAIGYNDRYTTGENPRIPVGATLEELKSGKVIECYVLNFNTSLNAKLQNLGIYSTYNFLRDYINANTGEYKDSTRFDDDIKQSKVCVKQTVKWDNDSQKVVAIGERVTFRDMFVNFANKSGEYLLKYPNEGNTKYDNTLNDRKSKLKSLRLSSLYSKLEESLTTLTRVKSVLERLVDDSSYDSNESKLTYLQSNGITNSINVTLDTKTYFSSMDFLPEKYVKLKSYVSNNIYSGVTISDSTTRDDLRKYLSGVNEAILIANLVKEYVTEIDIDNLIQDLECY